MQQIASFILLEIAHAVIAAACTATYSVILRTKQEDGSNSIEAMTRDGYWSKIEQDGYKRISNLN